MGRTFLQGQTVQWVPNENPGVRWEPNTSRNALLEAAEIPNHANGNSDDIRTNNTKRPKKSCMKRIVLVLVFLLLIVAGVVAWVFVKSFFGNDNTQDRSMGSLQDGPTSTPTTASPTSGPSATPTSLPTEVLELLYERPSESDCEAIARNETIPGRGFFEVARFGVDLEVFLTDDSLMTDELMQELLDATQQKILPSIVGCDFVVDRFTNDWRFVIFDAFLTGDVSLDKECIDQSLEQQNCYLVSLQLNLFLKGRVKSIDIVSLISYEHLNFAYRLGLSDSFSIVQLMGIATFNRTDSPSTVPSSAPSQLLFLQPSDSDCDAIRKNEPIAGREEMDVAQFGLDLKVVLTDESNMTKDLVNQVLDSFQQKILPLIVGCDFVKGDFMPDWRFVIFDAFVTGDSLPDESCTDANFAVHNCHRLSIQLHVFLKGSVRFLDIIRLISDEASPLFLGDLGLSDPFLALRLMGVEGLTPTASPTTAIP